MAGADVDSHAVQLMWDERYLYVVATVHDPEHVQDQTLSNAWQGDALWLYFTNTAQANRLSAKFTLAQTPDGPQRWDWLHAGFAEGAVLSWTSSEGGYRYEAAIPWATIDVDTPQVGMSIGFEAGRGVGGSSFMDLTGRDPDVAANLLQLTLVTTESGAELASAPEVALEIRLDDGDPAVIQETVSPDSDYF